MSLFDDSVRVDASPASHGEDSYRFLNRAASPYWEKVRTEHETWFRAYPAAAQPDVRSRFQSRLAAQHWGAWWELYLFTLFSRLGFAVEVHPPTGIRGTSPDFRCTNDDCDFYLEAAVVFSGISQEGRHAEREGWILDLVNEAKSRDFFVWLEFDAVGLERPRRIEVVAPIEGWLAELDADAVIASLADGNQPPQTTLAVRDWRMTLRAIPVKPEKRGRPDHRLLGIGPMSAGFVNDNLKLRNSLTRKFRHYGELGKPLVVGILAMSASVDRESVEEALFGSIALQYAADDPDVNRWIRQRNGVWMGEGGPIAKAVSAVAVSSRLAPWTCANGLPELWLNPWSTEPLSCSLPFAVATVDDEGVLTYREAQKSGHQILSLPADWPGPERAFP